MTRIISFLIIITFLIGCSGRPGDKRLLSISESIDEDPRQAIASLDSIDKDRLPESDGHFLDLLRIKARDKAYVTHTSDSLILSVVDYYADHKDSGLYPEALYYAGRVYSDMGDFPTALEYFHAAIDETSGKVPHNISLRGSTVSQTGRLLNSLRLYDQAIPFLEESIAIDSITGENVNKMYDCQLLGAVYMHAGKYTDAERLFQEARSIAMSSSPEDTIQQDMYLAAVKSNTDQLDSAVILIKDVPWKINRISRNNALAYAADIYDKAACPDSAVKYAEKLIAAGNFNYKKVGFRIMFSPGNITGLPQDSLISYVKDYHRAVEEYLNRNESRQVMMQQSFYNYQSHKRDKEKALADNHNLWMLLMCLCIIFISVIAVLLGIKYKKQKSILEMRETIDKLRILNRDLNRTLKDYVGIPETGCSGPASDDTSALLNGEGKISSDITCLRQELREELTALLQHKRPSKEIHPGIIDSPAYRSLAEYLEKGKMINETDPLWDDLDRIVTKYSGKFKARLNLLANGRLKKKDYHLILLIRCGMTPTNMTVLLGRTKGTISHRREEIGLKLMDENLSVKDVDDIIRGL